MPISSQGIGSGVNIREIIDKYIEDEGKSKIAKYDADEASALAKMTGYGNLKSSLTEFYALISNWQDNNPFEQKSVKISSTDEPVIAATAASTAHVGEYSIEVTHLATYHKVKTLTAFATADTVIGTGTLKFTVNSTVTHAIDIQNGANSVRDVAAKINETTDTTGIIANLVTTDDGVTIILTAKESGTDHAFTVSVENDGDGNNTDDSGLSRLASPHLFVLQDAENAVVKIEDMQIESSSNTIEDAIEGVTLNLLSTNTGAPITISIKDDIQGVKQKINDFVGNYNNVVDTINSLTKYTNNDKKNMGVLIGDTTVRSIQIQLRKTITNMHSSLPQQYSTLAQIGITTDKTSGKLIVNNDKLTTAIENHYDKIGQLFMDSNAGIATEMETFIDKYIDVNGILQARTQGLTKTIDVINQQRVQLERHLEKLEKKLMTQFSAMDKSVANLKSISTFLSQQLDSLVEPLSFRK